MPIPLPDRFAGLIFDCDGTLVDTAPAHFKAVRLALEAQGHTMAEAWYMARTGLTPDALLDAHEARVAAEPSSPPERPLDRAEVFRTYNGHFQRSLDLLREVRLVADLAREWHGRVPLWVATNGRLTNVEASLRVTGLLPLFDGIVSADEVARGKPAPDVFLETARRMQIPAEECVVLEDSDEGLAGARAAGMHAIDVRPVSSHREAD